MPLSLRPLQHGWTCQESCDSWGHSPGNAQATTHHNKAPEHDAEGLDLAISIIILPRTAKDPIHKWLQVKIILYALNKPN